MTQLLPATRRQSGDPLERYDTPSWCTRALMEYGPLPVGLKVIEPMAGANAITGVLEYEGGCIVAAFDIAPRADGITKADTLTPGFFEQILPQFDISVVTNAPFSQAAALWRRTQMFRRVAILVRITWLERTKDREDVVDPVRVIVLPRPKFTGKGGDSATSVWACWGDWPPGLVRLTHADKHRLMAGPSSRRLPSLLEATLQPLVP